MKNELHSSYRNTELVVMCFLFGIANKMGNTILMMEKTTFDDYIFVNIVKIVHIPSYTHTQYKAKYHLRNTIVAYLALLSAYNSTKFYFFFSFVVSIRLNTKRKFRIRSKNFPSFEKLVAFENLSTLLITLKVRKYNGCVSVEVPL